MVAAPFLLAWLLAASAPTPATRLEVTRTPSAAACPTDEEVHARVSARLGRAAFEPAGTRVVRIAFDRAGPRNTEATAEVTVVEDAGAVLARRRLQARERGCTELGEAVVAFLAVALETFDPPPAQPPPPVEPVVPVETNDKPTVETTSPPMPAPLVSPPPPAKQPTPPARRRWKRPFPRSPVLPAPASPRLLGLELRAGVLAGLGMMPSLSPGMGLGAGVRAGPLTLGMEVSGLAPGLVQQGNRTWWMGMAHVQGSACVRAGWLTGCGLLGGGGMAMGLQGALVGQGPVVSPWLSAGGRMGLRLPLWGGFHVMPALDVTAPLVRTAVRVDGQPRWSTPWWNVAGGAWLGWGS